MTSFSTHRIGVCRVHVCVCVCARVFMGDDVYDDASPQHSQNSDDLQSIVCAHVR